MYQVYSDELYHHGVKGMKWGVRKKIQGLSKKTKNSIKKRQNKRLAKSEYAKAKKMTNQELSEKINRINLEQNYLAAVERDRTSYKEAKASRLGKIGYKTVRELDKRIMNVGVSSIDIGAQLTRNAAINTANKYAPITKKPKK